MNNKENVIKSYSLCIDTSNKYCSVALSSKDKVIDFIESLAESQQSKNLFSLIDKLFSQNNITYNNIEDIYVTIGPGSFTGIRIGLAAAYGISIIRKIKVIGVSNFQVGIIHDDNITKSYVILDAGKGQIYKQDFKEYIPINDPIIMDNNIPLEEITMINAKLLAKASILIKNNKMIANEAKPFYVRDVNITKPKKNIWNLKSLLS